MEGCAETYASASNTPLTRAHGQTRAREFVRRRRAAGKAFAARADSALA